jgi:hypothetical protein
MMLVHRKRLLTAKGPAILRKTALGGLRSTAFLVPPTCPPLDHELAALGCAFSAEKSASSERVSSLEVAGVQQCVCE